MYVITLGRFYIMISFFVCKDQETIINIEINIRRRKRCPRQEVRHLTRKVRQVSKTIKTIERHFPAFFLILDE